MQLNDYIESMKEYHLESKAPYNEFAISTHSDSGVSSLASYPTVNTLIDAVPYTLKRVETWGDAPIIFKDTTGEFPAYTTIRDETGELTDECFELLFGKSADMARAHYFGNRRVFNMVKSLNLTTIIYE